MRIELPFVYDENEFKTFEDVDKSIPVYVPAESVSNYQSAEYWNEFTNI